MGQSCEYRPLIRMKIFLLSLLGSSALAQLKFGGSTSSGAKTSTNTKQQQTDTKFFTGNEGIDGGILGLGAGLLGGAVLGGVGSDILGGLLGGGNSGNGCGNGRHGRQTDGTNTKFLGALLGGGSGGCNCGRKRRQAPGEDQPGTRFFGLGSLLGGGNSNCCNCPQSSNNNNGGYNSGYNNGYNSGYNNGQNNGGSGYNSGQQQRCQCNYNLTFQDKNGYTNGACKRADETGRLWCYTQGSGCDDGRQSQRFPNNPWSYQACAGQG